MKDCIKYYLIKLVSVFYRLFFVFPIRKNKVVVDSFAGKGYCDNPKSIVDLLIKEKKDIDVCWVVNDLQTEFPEGIRLVKRHSIGEFYEYATAKVWINNSRIAPYLRKRSKQVLVQTWHGGFAIKKIGKSATHHTKCGDERIRLDSIYTDVMVSNSKFCTQIFRKDFNYNGEILEVGSPRLDILFYADEKRKSEIYQRLHITKYAHIALYAPTFRDNGSVDGYDIDYNVLKSSLEKRFGGTWLILVRFHPLAEKQMNAIAYSEWKINATVIQDIYDLFMISDILITDYSSTAMEFAVFSKPVFLYTSDLIEYQKGRGLYFQIEQLPFEIAMDNKQLEGNILNFDNERYIKKINNFMTTLGTVETGTATEAVVDYIIRKAGYIR